MSVDIKQYTRYSMGTTIDRNLPAADGTYHYIEQKFFYFGNNGANKIGYCVKPAGVGLPIFLLLNKPSTDSPTAENVQNTISNNKIYIGKTGMYEVQSEEEEISFPIYGILVPNKEKGKEHYFNYTIDYVSNI